MNRGVYGLAKIHKARDNSAKAILTEPELFVEFIRNFIPVEILKDIKPEDIEDIPPRLLSLIIEQKDGDTIKRINLEGNKPLFVIAIIEHESQVNFRASYKMLLYIALILEAYEKEINKKNEGNAKITQTKDFKYPPILPIIFYDGDGDWTAQTNFLYKTEMSEIFEKYIPKFEYELVSLKDYTFADLAKYGDVLSLFMMIDKLKTVEAFRELSKVLKEHADQLKDMNVPPHLKELLIKVITALLNKINVPQSEINALAERIDERGVSEIMSIEDYDVQATRREAEQQRAEVENRLKSAIKGLFDKGTSIAEIASMLSVTEEYITTLLPELSPA